MTTLLLFLTLALIVAMLGGLAIWAFGLIAEGLER